MFPRWLPYPRRARDYAVKPSWVWSLLLDRDGLVAEVSDDAEVSAEGFDVGGNCAEFRAPQFALLQR